MADTDIDSKECLKMAIQAVEVHSVQRAEELVGKLVDIINSEDCRIYVNEKKNAVLDRFDVIEDELSHSVFESIKCLRQLVEENQVDRWFDSDVVNNLLTVPNMQYILSSTSEVLDDKSKSPREKIQEIWNGLTRNIKEENDVDKTREHFEQFVANWRNNCKRNLPADEIARREASIREDFELGLQQKNSAMERFLDSLRDDFADLKQKLKGAQQRIAIGRGMVNAAAVTAGTGAGLAQNWWLTAGLIAAGALVAGLAGAVVGAGLAGIPVARTARKTGEVYKKQWDDKIDERIRENAGDRFLKRQDKSWYPKIEASLFDYIRGRMNEGELHELLTQERLEEDLEHIRTHLTKWITRCRDKIQKMKIPQINKAAVKFEVKRSWAFAKALLLEEEKDVKFHSELLRQTVNAACDGTADFAPIISMGRMQDETKCLKVKFVVSASSAERDIESFLYQLTKSIGCRVGQRRISRSELKYELEFVSGERDAVRKTAEYFVSRLSQLAEIHTRAILLGDYEISGGASLAKPAYNRIYGPGLKAPGFMPTVFGYLDYSGEKYFCPTGWRRISLNVAKSSEEFDSKYGGWHVAYHGTKHELAATILTTGFIPSQGAFSDGDPVVYFSPSIVYCSHPRYAEVYEVKDKHGNKKYMQMVLQVRVNPSNIWKKVGGTLRGAFDRSNGCYEEDRDSKAADSNFPRNENLEWLVKPIPGMTGVDMFRNMFVIYGIMVRVSSTDPKTQEENSWWNY